MNKLLHSTLFGLILIGGILIFNPNLKVHAAVPAPGTIDRTYFNNKVFYGDAIACGGNTYTRYLKDFSSPDITPIWGVGNVTNVQTIKITPYTGYWVCDGTTYRYNSKHYIKFSYAPGLKTSAEMASINNGTYSSGTLPNRVNTGNGSLWITHPESTITLSPGWNTISVNYQSNTCTTLPSGTCSSIDSISPSLITVFYNSVPQGDGDFSCPTGFKGWAIDKDTPDSSIKVRVTITDKITGAVSQYDVLADKYDALANYYNFVSGNHGYLFPLPSNFFNDRD